MILKALGWEGAYGRESAVETNVLMSFLIMASGYLHERMQETRGTKMDREYVYGQGRIKSNEDN